MRRFGLAALQLELGPGNNLDVIAAEIATARRRFPWIDMVMLAELASYGVSLEPPSRCRARPSSATRRSRASTACGCCRARSTSGPATHLQHGAGHRPDGTVVARHRKIYPFVPYEMNVACGNQHTVFDIPDVGRFGVSICYDMWFPETTRTLAWMGAEVILHPGLTNTIDRDVEISIARARPRRINATSSTSTAPGRLAYRTLRGLRARRRGAARRGHRARDHRARARPRSRDEHARARLAGTRPAAQEFSRHGRQLSTLRTRRASRRCIRKPGTPRAPRRARQKIMRFITMSIDRRIPRSALSLAVAQALGAAAGIGLARARVLAGGTARARARDGHGAAPRTGHPGCALQHLGDVGRRDRAAPDIRFAGTAARHSRRRRRGPRAAQCRRRERHPHPRPERRQRGARRLRRIRRSRPCRPTWTTRRSTRTSC